jgi:hypothetical protein
MIEENEQSSDQEKLENKRNGKRERESEGTLTQELGRQKQAKNRESTIESSNSQWEPEEPKTKNNKEEEKEKSRPINIEADNFVSGIVLPQASAIAKKHCKTLQEAAGLVHQSQTKKLYSIMFEVHPPLAFPELDFIKNVQGGHLTHSALYSSLPRENSMHHIFGIKSTNIGIEAGENGASTHSQPIENKSATGSEGSRSSSSLTQTLPTLNTSTLATFTPITASTMDVAAHTQTNLNRASRPNKAVAPVNPPTRIGPYRQNTVTPAPNQTLPMPIFQPVQGSTQSYQQIQSSSSASSIPTSQTVPPKIEVKDWHDLRAQISVAYHNKNANTLNQLAAEFLKGNWKTDFFAKEVLDPYGVSTTSVVVPQNDHLFNLADYYRTGSVVEKKTHLAVQILSKLATLGQSHAQYVLGKAFLEGDSELGIIQSYASGIENLQRAADKNHGLALELLGQCHENGTGVRPALWTSLSCYRAAQMLDNGEWNPKKIPLINQAQSQEKERELVQPQPTFTERVNASIERVMEKIKQKEAFELQQSTSKSAAKPPQPNAESASTSLNPALTLSTSSSSSSTTNKVAVGQNIYSKFSAQNRDKPSSSTHGVSLAQ